MPQVYFNLPADDLELVDALADMRDGNRSQVLREAVAAYLYDARQDGALTARNNTTTTQDPEASDGR